MLARIFSLSLLSVLTACGAASYRGTTASVVSPQSTGGMSFADDTRVRDEVMRGSLGGAATGSTSPSPPPAAPQDAPMRMMAESVSADTGSGGGGDSGGEEADARYAQNVPSPPPPPTPVGGTQHAAADAAARIADDAHRGPLLVYTATVFLSVFEVERTERAVIDIARELGGFLSLQNDTQVTIRVPAANFREALARIEGVGDVLHRNVEALDVSEEFRDLTIRLANATAMRDRLQALLAQAHTSDEALAVERELERVTLEVEQIKGRMQFLGDRLAYSTITVMFQPHSEGVDQPGTFRLPFPWLDELTLANLLNLPYQN